MKRQPKWESPHSNRIPLPFEQAVEGLLQVKPKKKPATLKKKASRKKRD